MQDKNYIEKVLSLSSDHVHSFHPTFGLVNDKATSPRYVEHEHGWIVFVDESVICADWFKPIMEYAIKEDCTLILFDSYCPINSKFKTYSW